MRSVNYGPTATRDSGNNLVFSEAYMRAYKHDLDLDKAEADTKFQFFNGPHGGGKKLVVICVNTGVEGTVIEVTARDAGSACL